LSAARSAAQTGAKVTLLDGYSRPGGQYYRLPPERLQSRATQRQQEGLRLWQSTLDAGVEILSERVVWNLTKERVLSIAGPHGSGTIQAGAVIVASGAYERLVPFRGWTLPGVITSGAAQALLYQGVQPGRRALVAGCGPLQWTTAAELLEAGVEVAAVLEGAPLFPHMLEHLPAMWGQWGRALEGAHALATFVRHRVPFRRGWGILAALGETEVEGALIARLDAGWRPIPGTEREVICDTICVGWGFIPFNALIRLAGAEQGWRADLGGEVPLRGKDFETSVPGIYAVGDGAGTGGYRMAMLEGQVAGYSAAARMGHNEKKAREEIHRLQPAVQRESAFQRLFAALFTPGLGVYELAKEDTTLCRCEGARLADLKKAVAGGARTTGEVKAITRCGMGECQGRMCGQTVAQITARLTGQTVEQVGLYTPRPPVFSLPVEMLIGTEEDTGLQ
jgi:NADPH-dependent 2,4-dienoyl-CoA reductase/sulfur reductase-like enzyme